MPKAISLSIGLNSVDKKHYAGWNGKLSVCENDVHAMNLFFKSKKIKQQTSFLTKQATRENVLSFLDEASKKCVKGDLLILYYSGHGGNEIPDANGDEAGTGDHYDETWCLYNGQLIDDELLLCWKKFKTGVRILVISDSCYSGDIVKIMPFGFEHLTSKEMPSETGHKTFQQNEKKYETILRNIKSKELKEAKQTKVLSGLKASVLQISSSQEYQTSCAETDEFPDNSLFTAVFLKILKSKKIKTYTALEAQLKKTMPDFQIPRMQVLGNSTLKMMAQKPFVL